MGILEERKINKEKIEKRKKEYFEKLEKRMLKKAQKLKPKLEKKIINSIRQGGSCVVVTKYVKKLDVREIIKEINKQFNGEIELTYSPREYWFEEDCIKINEKWW